jgi:TolB-like protein/Tfp pilus assembly protein PilF
MAPEQASGARHLTPAADVYSLGAILFHLLTGRVPFRGDNALDLLRQAAERPAPRLRALNNKVPADLETICLKCLEKNPAARYSSAASLADDLDRFLARRAIHARRANPITHAVRWSRRNPTMAALSAALLALLLLLFFVLRPTPKIVDLGKSIAVLPFENLSDDQTNASFANAIQNDVLTNLAKVADLKVISRASVMQYRDKAKSTREIGQALNVAHVLEGSVQKIGGRVRVSVQLIDTRSDAHIWAEQFDRDLADVFALQSELAEKIVSRLTATLSPREKASIEAPPTRDLEAYNLYLRARELMFNAASAGDPKGEAAKAIELLDQAVARDPSFALAYSLLARVHVDLYYNSGRQAAPHLAQARVCVENALRLAPDSGEAHFANAFYLFHGVDDQTRALEEFAIATRELPNNADALSWKGILERRMGRWPEALRDLRRATELDPHNGRPPIDLIVCYEALRNYAEADLAIERALIAIPRLTNRFRARKAEIALLKGDTQACRALLESIPSDYEPNGTIPYLRSRMCLWNREYAEAARVLDAIPKEELKEFTRAWVARDQAFIACARNGPGKAEPVLLDAIDAWQAELGGNSDEAEAHSYIALWSAALGRKEAALRESQKAVDLRPLSRDATNAPVLLDRQALVYAWCGERELALKQLEALLKIPGGPSLGELRLNPAWDVLRDEPRFQAVVAAAAEPIRLN